MLLQYWYPQSILRIHKRNLYGKLGCFELYFQIWLLLNFLYKYKLNILNCLNSYLANFHWKQNYFILFTQIWTIEVNFFAWNFQFFSKNCTPSLKGCPPQVRVDLELVEIGGQDEGGNLRVGQSGINPNGQISSTPNGSTCVVNQNNHNNELNVSANCLGNNNSHYNNDNTAVTTYFAEDGRPVSAACVWTGCHFYNNNKFYGHRKKSSGCNPYQQFTFHSETNFFVCDIWCKKFSNSIREKFDVKRIGLGGRRPRPSSSRQNINLNVDLWYKLLMVSVKCCWCTETSKGMSKLTLQSNF